MIKNKYLLFTTQYTPQIGGVPNFYYQFLNFFPNNKMIVLTADRCDADNTDKTAKSTVLRTIFLKDYRVEYSLSFFVKSLFVMAHYLFAIFRFNISVVIVGQADIAMLCMGYISKKLLSKQFVVFLHGDGDSPYTKLRSDDIKIKIYNKVDLFIVNSNFTKQRLQAKYSITDEKILIIYPGVDTNKFYPFDVCELKKHLKMQSKKILLTVGRLDKRKGHDNVIKSLPSIVKSIPEIIYIIVGDGDQRHSLECLVRQLHLNEYVKFIGAVSDDELPQYYNLCDIFIMANRELEDGDTEGFGMVFIEANACGKPVLGGRFGGAREAIEDNISGLTIDTTSTDDIANSVTTLFINDKVRQQLGQNGLRRASEKFEWQTTLEAGISKLDAYI